MKTCPYCAHVNREGVFFCEECGHPFIGDQQAVLATTRLMQQGEQSDPYSNRTAWGTAHFEADTRLTIRIRDRADMLTLDPVHELIIGRADPREGVEVDLDLTSFGAAEQGVSRRHAAIRRGEDTITLIDLESTNGTYLNGQRLLPHQPRVLRDGDEVRLGRLVFHLYFNKR